MSRIGKNPISIPQGVTISQNGNRVSVKGKNGELQQDIHPDISLSIEEGQATLSRKDNSKENASLHGLYRALIQNMVQGVTEGFKKELELVGVGYKASNQGNVLDLALGYSHNIIFEIPSELKVTTETLKGQNPKITIEGIDKQLVGQVAAKIRSLRKPEPYKGKGVKYVGEYIRRKAGKSASAK